MYFSVLFLYLLSLLYAYIVIFQTVNYYFRHFGNQHCIVQLKHYKYKMTNCHCRL